MKNPFSLSAEKLKVLLDAYTDWCEANQSEKGYVEKEKAKSQERKKSLLNKEYLKNANTDDFEKVIFDYSRTLEGPAHIHLGKPRISGEKVNVKKNLLYLIESSDDPYKKAASVLEGDLKISHFSKAFWSPLFQAQYPQQLPNWNNKTESFLKKIGVNISTSKLSIEEKYKTLSNAFDYLQSLKPELNYYSINHLMHYGTVIKEGTDLIDQLLSGSFEVANNFEEKILTARKAHVFKERLEIRKESETKAKNLLTSKIGKFDEKDLREFFSHMNHDFWNGKHKSNRFGLAYIGSNLNALANQINIVNEWMENLWETDEKDLKELVDEFYATKPIKNAGTAFPSVILYLRNPSIYNLCFKKMVRTLSEHTQFSESRYSGEFYFQYNDVVNKLKNNFSLLPQELDIILTATTTDTLPYTIKDLSEDTGLEIEKLAKWKRAIERKGQAIIYGPPGTGKTFVAERMAKYLVVKGDGFFDLLQFHPAYSYEDFMQGIRPQARDDGSLDYPIIQGRFLQFCEKAEGCDSPCILIIDEINRANLAKVFGELMYLLEYRDKKIPLASGGDFSIPENVRIIGTMNTADRSIALVDHALKRRFAFFALHPDYDVLRRFHESTNTNVDNLVDMLKKLNRQIGDSHYEVGISYFLITDLESQIEDIWQMEIEPYIEEYFFDQPDKVDEFRWNKIGVSIL